MNRTLNLQKSLAILGIPVLIIVVMILLTKSSIFTKNSNSLSIAITFDLLLTVPFIYFLQIRKTNIPKITILSFVIIGMVVCTIIIPSNNQYYLDLFKAWIFPVLELSIVSYVIYKLTRFIKRYKVNKNGSVDFFTVLKDTCREILPKAAVIPVVTEIAVFYYGFIYWKKRNLSKNEFSYHKNSGTISLLIALIVIIGIETVVFHILLAKWNLAAAWILTFLSIYSGIQIIGFIKSMYKRPISIENNKLFLRYGIMNETIIELCNIDSIEISSKDIELDKITRKLSFLGALENHNMIIRLKEENTLIGLYGIKRTYKNLAIHIDDKNEFKNRIISVSNRLKLDATL
ncbi:hypothetical protein J8L88_17090 [Aquimarina sp. MMG015]|uniref:hypothetical protein n=1 Tax=Aquimarina sp. MMG015 TaxID=2822689 RepID=UPI001B3A1F4B|nr:hypothetical protein [Aquimarina sp. MMG015]MBQ4804579.1 hypothetical protein [Aquimarina sp. MMG015]